MSALCLLTLVNGAQANGLIEVNSAYYHQDNKYDDAHAAVDTHLDYEHSWQLTEQSNLWIKPRLGLDTHNLYANSLTLQENSPNRSTLAIQELTFTHYFDNFEVNIGKRVFSWGLGDMYNPSDHVNPVDTLDPINNVKLGQWSASLSYLGSSSNINLILIPRRTSSRLPQQDNRWFRSLEAVQTAAEIQLGFRPTIGLDKQVKHHKATAGIQISSGEWLLGWDVELSYLHSQDATGVYLPELNGTQLDLIRVFPRFNEASVGLATAMGEYTFHGVTTYRNTQNNQQDDDYFTYLIGARRAFYTYDLVEVLEEVTVALEYVKENISTHRDPNSSYVNSGFGRTLTNSLLMNLTFKFTEDSSLVLGLINNFDLKDRYVSFEFSHQINDDLKISTGLDLLNGTPDSLFGQWASNDRLFINTRYHF